MNPIRHFLSRDRVARRCVFFLIFTVLFARALLSGAVMFDPDAPAGSFGLVICSGQGPLFPPTPMPGMDMGTDMHTGMAMSMPMAASPPVAATHAPTADVSLGDRRDSADHSDSAGLCPFSAVFLTAIASLFALSLFLGKVTIERFRDTPGGRQRIPPITHHRPLPRAPPDFA